MRGSEPAGSPKLSKSVSMEGADKAQAIGDGHDRLVRCADNASYPAERLTSA